MPLSYAHSRGDGINRNFDVPCEYLSKSHVSVRVDGVSVPFTWVDTYRLRTAAAPAKDTVVEVRRTTPRDKRLVTFTDGSTLVQSDLNTSTLQAFFLAQEAFDQGAASMAVTEDGQFSALNRRLTTMADPVNPQDAVTKSWALSVANTNLTEAVAAKNDAVTARTGSETARDASQVARGGSENARAGSEAACDLALSYRNTAEAHKNASEAARNRAETAKADIENAKTFTSQKATEADNSAKAAAKSAQDAAMFDPSSYYTKSQVDFATVNKSGDTMTGALSTREFTVDNGANRDAVYYWKQNNVQRFSAFAAGDGSYLTFARYSNAGGYIGPSLQISRGNGFVDIFGGAAVAGELYVRAALELGKMDGSAGFAVMDFHTSATVRDYNCRIICDSNANDGNGLGTMNILAGNLMWNGNRLISMWDKATATDIVNKVVNKFPDAEAVGHAIATITPPSLGVGQTWQNMLSQRALNTTYQNTTGRAISISVTIVTSSNGPRLWVSADNSNWVILSDHQYQGRYTVSEIIPSGWYYRFTPVDGNFSSGPQYWAELR
ncbi:MULTISPECIES: phage tail fiber domain-containing protein [unclassified Rhizobium]|uniref:phage tail fiber domain-containing protein n=1 Tax=unclassified Rhizobium TaxID=2613769 RepID=UPI00177FE09E|nr:MULTISPECIES: phage tail fiber protein [unclassified Rhizobium]MBD8687064.1 hypothetical protein [Rhizobium sp. CFBP 13644]MBD8691133.1 hypothetical protein [Rhizobium sp. CFBP 13717]